jgi:muramoyltetrapeptide carboxypeptidase
VAVVAPAGPAPEELLRRGVRLLESWGLDVSLGEHVLARDARLGYLAGPDADRAADLHRAWADPAIEAVFCARGGYGCLRLLDLLDRHALAAPDPAPLLVGSSDATALHAAVGTRTGAPTLFAPMIATEALLDDAVAAEHLRRMLFAPQRVHSLGRGHDPLVPGEARGVLAGGNLSLLDPSAPPPDGAIVLLEDVTEEPYRLDHLLTRLLRSGWFTGVAGIALGSWTGCGPLSQVRAVLADRLGGLGVPVAWELGFGHCPEALSVPLGVPATVDADGGRLVVE